VAANMRRVFLLIYRIVGNVDDAQDLTQEAFIKALQRQISSKIRQSGPTGFRIASNTAIDFLRRAAASILGNRRATRILRHVTLEVRNSAFCGRSVANVCRVAGILTDRERTAILLRTLRTSRGRSRRALGCSKATVRSHIAQRARKAPQVSERRSV